MGRSPRAHRGDEELQFHRRGPGRAGGLVHPDPHDDDDGRLGVRHRRRRRHQALRDEHQRRPAVRLRQGREDRAPHADRVRRRGCAALDDRSAREALHAARLDDCGRAHAVLEEHRLFARPAALPDEARGLRSEGQPQLPEPRHLGLRADQLGRGARPRRRRDPALQDPARAGLDHGQPRVAPHLGEHRLLHQLGAQVLQRDRLHARRPQPRQLGGLVLGRDAPLRLQHAARPDRELQPGRGPDEGSRDGGVLVRRPGGDQRLLQRARRDHPADVAAGARHRGRAHRSVLQPQRGAARRQVVRAQARHRHRDGARDRPRLDHRGALRQAVRRRALRRLRAVARLRPRERGRHPEDARVAGARDRHPREGRPRARAPLGHAEDLSRRRRLGQRPRRRVPFRDRHPVGAGGRVPARDAGHGQARRQLRPPAVGHAGRPALLLPRLRGRRPLGRHREHRHADQPLPADAAAAHVQPFGATRAAPADPGGDPRGQEQKAIRGTARRSRGSSRSSRIRRRATRR